MKCPSGTFSFMGSGSCTKCPDRTYSKIWASVCYKCNARYYSKIGSSSWTKCPAGTTSKIGSTSCIKLCNPGYYYYLGIYKICPGGTYSFQIFQSIYIIQRTSSIIGSTNCKKWLQEYILLFRDPCGDILIILRELILVLEII